MDAKGRQRARLAREAERDQHWAMLRRHKERLAMQCVQMCRCARCQAAVQLALAIVAHELNLRELDALDDELDALEEE